MLGKRNTKTDTNANTEQSKGWRLPDRLGRHEEKATVLTESVISTSPNRLRFPAYIILTVDPSQSPTPLTGLGLFSFRRRKRKSHQ